LAAVLEEEEEGRKERSFRGELGLNLDVKQWTCIGYHEWPRH